MVRRYPVDDEYIPWMTNRQKALRPRLTQFYCDCDLDAVGAWKRCSVCGSRTGKKRHRKPRRG
jgi:hypothetical protein